MKVKINASRSSRSRSFLVLCVLAAMLVVSLIGTATPAAAQEQGNANLQVFASLLIYLVIGFAILGVVAGALLAAGKREGAIAAGVVAIVLLALSVGSLISGMTVSSANVDCSLQANFANPQCKPSAGYTAKWSAQWGCSTTLVGCAQAVHDAVSEFPAAPFNLCNTNTPASSGIAPLSTPARNSLVVNNVTTDSSVFGGSAQLTLSAYNDPARVAASNPSCDAPDLRVTLTNAPAAAAGGYQPVPLWGRITVSSLIGTINGTTQPTFYCSVNAGPHLFWGLDADSGSNTHTTTHRWVSAWNSQPACPGGGASLTGDWIPLGSSSTTSTYVNGEWVSFGFILQHSGAGATGANLGGICDFYNTLAGATCLTLKIEVGTQPGNTAGWQGNVVYFTYNIVRQ